MPRVSDHLVKSAIRLVRQSTTVPNTSNTSAFTAEVSDMLDPVCFVCSFRVRYARPGMIVAKASIQVKLVQLTMLGLDVAHGAGDGTHHHRLGLDDILAELDARQQRPRRHAGSGEQAVALHHVLAAVNHAGIADAHLARALSFLVGVENDPAL